LPDVIINGIAICTSQVVLKRGSRGKEGIRQSKKSKTYIAHAASRINT
jgi:hypothetical protein